MNPSDQSQLPQEFERTNEVDQVSTPAPKKSKASLVLGMLLILVLASCAALGWMSYGLANQNASFQDKVDDKDKQIEKLTSQLSKASKPVEGSDNAGSSSSDSEVIAAALAAAKADVTYTGKTLEAAVTKVESDFAAVNVIVQPDGPNFRQILKKSNGVWVSVFLGPNAPSQDMTNRYAIPASISQP